MKKQIIVLIMVVLSGCQKGYLTPKELEPFGDRKIFMALTPGSGDTDLSSALEKVLDMGFDGPGDLNIDWGTMEPFLGQYEDPDGIIAWNRSNLQGKPLHLTLAPIQTTYTSLPSELKGLAWNDITLINAYIDALTYLHSQLNGVDIQSVAVGNEVDIVLGADSTAWNNYTDFFTIVSDEARNLWPNADIGVKLTYDVVIEGNDGYAASILTASDAVLTTYYPKVEDFKENKNLVEENFVSVVNEFPNKPIHLVEVGFPTSKKLKSSEKDQKNFVCDVFSSWDGNKDAIKSVTFVWLYDLSQETLDALAITYGSNDPEFLNFLGSLGYISYDKEQKESYELLMKNIEKRK